MPEDHIQIKIDQVIGPRYLNLFYAVYFPAFVGALVIGTFFGNQIIGGMTGKYGSLSTLDQISQVQFIVNLYLSMAILIPVLLIFISEYRIRSMNMNLSSLLGRKGTLYTLIYTLIGLGVYFFLEFVLSTTILVTRGQEVIFKAQSVPTSPDFYQIYIYTLISPDTNARTERNLLLLSFVLLYIGIEYLLRGLIANYSRVAKVGMGTAVLVSATIQAIAFSNIFLLPNDWDVLIYIFLQFFLWGLISGIIWWRTRNFWGSALFSVLLKLLSTDSTFQRVFLDFLAAIQEDLLFIQLPSNFTSQVSTGFTFLRIALIVLAIPSITLGYNETIPILRRIISDIRFQKRGLAVVLLSFIVIDIVFTAFVSNTNAFSLIVGYILAIVVLRFVLPFIFRLFDPPTPASMALVMGGLLDDPRNLNETFPLNVKADIEFLESSDPWYFDPRKMAIVAGLGYIYLLFITATYRQLSRLDLENQIRFIVFFLILPGVSLSILSYFWSKSLRNGYFFSKPWRRWLNFLVLTLLLWNTYVWTLAASKVSFHWSDVPFFLPLTLTVWPTEIKDEETEIAQGIGQFGRKETFRFVERVDRTAFSKSFESLMHHPHDQVSSGVIILATKIGLLTLDELIGLYKGEEVSRGGKVGILISLGLLEKNEARWTLLDALASEDIEVRKAAFWSLGRVGKPEDLGRMVSILEGNPHPSLMRIAEQAILKIDPNYPLAGVRDNLSISF